MRSVFYLYAIEESNIKNSLPLDSNGTVTPTSLFQGWVDSSIGRAVAF